jgi:hypothetical protein
MKRKQIILIGTLLVILCCGAFIFLLREPEDQEPILSFLGCTNEHYAAFKLENPSGSSIVYYTGLPQVKSNGVWAHVRMDSSGGSLGERSSMTFSVEAPVKACEWRVPVFWRKQVDKPRFNLKGTLQVNATKFRMWWSNRRGNSLPSVKPLKNIVDVKAVFSPLVVGVKPSPKKDTPETGVSTDPPSQHP